jgi:hypothetical protein
MLDSCSHRHEMTLGINNNTNTIDPLSVAEEYAPPMPSTEENSHDELYVEDLSPSFVNQVKALDLAGQLLRTPMLSPVRVSSPPFQQPDLWHDIELAREERMKNERDTNEAIERKEHMQRVAISLVYRMNRIDAANRLLWRARGRQTGRVLPEAWHAGTGGLLLGLSNDPRLLGWYLVQEKRIVTLLNYRKNEAQDWPASDMRNAESACLASQLQQHNGVKAIQDNASVIDKMLDVLKAKVESDSQNDMTTSTQTEPVLRLIPVFVEYLRRDSKLRTKLAELETLERYHYPWRFDWSSPTPSTQTSQSRTPSPTLTGPPSQSPEVDREIEAAPPAGFVSVVRKMEKQLATDKLKLDKGDETVRSRSAVIDTAVSEDICDELCQYPQLKERLERIRGEEMKLFPGRYPQQLK